MFPMRTYFYYQLAFLATEAFLLPRLDAPAQFWCFPLGDLSTNHICPGDEIGWRGHLSSAYQA